MNTIRPDMPAAAPPSLTSEVPLSPGTWEKFKALVAGPQTDTEADRGDFPGRPPSPNLDEIPGPWSGAVAPPLDRPPFTPPQWSEADIMGLKPPHRSGKVDHIVDAAAAVGPKTPDPVAEPTHLDGITTPATSTTLIASATTGALGLTMAPPCEETSRDSQGNGFTTPGTLIASATTGPLGLPVETTRDVTSRDTQGNAPLKTVTEPAGQTVNARQSTAADLSLHKGFIPFEAAPLPPRTTKEPAPPVDWPTRARNPRSEGTQ